MLFLENHLTLGIQSLKKITQQFLPIIELFNAWTFGFDYFPAHKPTVSFRRSKNGQLFTTFKYTDLLLWFQLINIKFIIFYHE